MLYIKSKDVDLVYARGGRSCERYSAVRSNKNGFHVAAHSQKIRLVFLTICTLSAMHHSFSFSSFCFSLKY